MKKVILLFIALWGVISGGINAQSSLPRIMIEMTGELSNEKRVSAVFTLEQTDEATGSTTTETYNCLVKYGGESSRLTTRSHLTFNSLTKAVRSCTLICWDSARIAASGYSMLGLETVHACATA